MEKKLKEELRKLFEKRLNDEGFKMSKCTNRGSYGLFLRSEDTYDDRVAYSFEALQKLNREGFKSDEDAGLWIFNMFQTINKE